MGDAVCYGQVAQAGAAAVATSPAGAGSRRAEPNADLLLEKLREHILEKGMCCRYTR